MKILWMSKHGECLGLAQEMQRQGDEVSVYIQDRKFEYAGLGMIDRPTNWKPVARNADLVCFDSIGFSTIIGQMESREAMTFGVSVISDKLGIDRHKQNELFDKIGIIYPQCWFFDSPVQAQDITDAWEAPGYRVEAVNGEHLSKVVDCPDRETMLWALQNYPSGQELFVQKSLLGVEVTVEGWFNGESWIEPFFYVFDEDFFGTTVYVPKRYEQLINLTITKMGPFLKVIEYKGPISLDIVANEDGIFVTGIMTGVRSDSFHAICRMIETNIGSLMYQIANDQYPETYSIVPGLFSTVLRLTHTVYPYSQPNQDDRGMPIFVNNQDLNGLWLIDAYQNDTMYRWACVNGLVAKASGIGTSPKKSYTEAHNRLKGIKMQGTSLLNVKDETVSIRLKTLKRWRYA